MSFFGKLFGKGTSTSGDSKAVKLKARTCMVCGKTGLKHSPEVTDGKFDIVARECPRCWGEICVFCLKELPKHEDGSGSLCPACNKYGLFELTGHSAASRDSCRRGAEERYGK